MMVGYWELSHQEIFESFIRGTSLNLKEPQQVDGPGCINCGKHWMDARNEACTAEEVEEAIEEVGDEREPDSDG